jgi:hypothetical protein
VLADMEHANSKIFANLLTAMRPLLGTMVESKRKTRPPKAEKAFVID